MSSNRERRVIKELRDIHADKERSGVTADICDADGNVNHLKGTLTAPPDSPYAGATFKVDIKIPSDYPFKAPSIKFETKIWHPNISSQTVSSPTLPGTRMPHLLPAEASANIAFSYTQGAICLDVLGNAWSPVHTIKSLLISLRMLLEVPNPKDPQDAEVAKMMIDNPELFAKIANEWAVKYAGAAVQEAVPAQYRSQQKAQPKKADDIHKYVSRQRYGGKKRSFSANEQGQQV